MHPDVPAPPAPSTSARSAAAFSQPAFHERFVRSLWARLRCSHPELPATIPEGIAVTKLADGSVTTARSTVDRFFACEVRLPAQGCAHEMYHVPHKGDVARAGWRTRELRTTSRVPDAWVHAVSVTPGVLTGSATPRVELEFAHLVIELCARGEVSQRLAGTADQVEAVRGQRLAALHSRITPIAPLTAEDGLAGPESDDAPLAYFTWES